MKPELLSSAFELPSLRESIADFYGGCAKDLDPVKRDPDVPARECQWAVVFPRESAKAGQVVPGVRVVSRRGQFRFEMV